jgi:hypothetical protein
MRTNEKLEKIAVKLAIENAEKLLHGVPVPEGEIDPRWQAIIKVADYIETEPHEVWCFIKNWGKHANEDVRTAVATCLLEHLLEYFFEEYFPLVKESCYKSKRFALTFQMCSQFGRAKLPKNSKAFNKLQRGLG